MADKHRIVFLCTGNCFRSQMAEAILHHLDSERFEAASAGSHPAGYVHPLAVDVLDDMQIPVVAQYSKSWEKFVGRHVDLLITVCDSAAQEVCPVWPDGPPVVHWPVPDPTFHPGPPAEQAAMARAVAERLVEKIRRLVALDWEHRDAEQLRTQLEDIAKV